ncbi:MAG: pilus assembly protein [Acidobacteria bacterium]|nr:pilus assembly protein [Acidobacteriota bacterium]
MNTIYSMRRRGSIMLETVLFMPILLLLLLGSIELARVTYTYFTLQKTLYAIARYVGTQRGVNFCDDTDATVALAKNYILTGTADGTGSPVVTNLTADQIQVRIERYSADAGSIGECDCASSGCDITNGGQSPDYIVVSIPDGYSIRLAIPQLPLDPILLRPHVRVPFQGT